MLHSTSGYFLPEYKNTSINMEMEITADIFNGRIVIVFNIWVKFKAVQIFRKVDNVRKVGGMRPNVEGRLKFCAVIRGELREQAGEMVQLVQAFIFTKTALEFRQATAEVIAGDENFLVPYTVHADFL